jgi:hypothetical protein
MSDKRANERLDLKPDAWSSFERAVDVVAKSPPQHRTAKPSEKGKQSPTKGGASASKSKSVPPRA